MAETEDKEEREFADGPWAVKWLAGVDKRAAYEARRRAKKTAGVWIGEAIREKVARERSDITEVDVIPPGESSLRLIDGISPPLADFGQSVAIARELTQIRGAKLSDRMTNAMGKKLAKLMGLEGDFDRVFQKRQTGASAITKTSVAPAADDDR